MAVATLFFILSFTVTYIHKYSTFVQYTLPSPFTEAALSVFLIAFAQREKPPRGAELGFELGPAVQQYIDPPPSLHPASVSSPRTKEGGGYTPARR